MKKIFNIAPIDKGLRNLILIPLVSVNFLYAYCVFMSERFINAVSNVISLLSDKNLRFESYLYDPMKNVYILSGGVNCGGVENLIFSIVSILLFLCLIILCFLIYKNICKSIFEYNSKLTDDDKTALINGTRELSIEEKRIELEYEEMQNFKKQNEKSKQ